MLLDTGIMSNDTESPNRGLISRDSSFNSNRIIINPISSLKLLSILFLTERQCKMNKKIRIIEKFGVPVRTGIALISIGD